MKGVLVGQFSGSTEWEPLNALYNEDSSKLECLRGGSVQMTPSDLELAQMQAAALFVHDDRGRLLRINEPDPTDPAPRFFLARTVAGNLWRVRCDLPADLAAALERLAADEPVVRDLHEPARHMAEYTALLQQHAPLSSTDAGPAYYLPELDP